MRKVGITGGKGFVGQNLATYLEKQGYDVVKHTGDVLNPVTLPRFDFCDDIVHLAGLNRAEPLDILHTNVLGTLNVLEYCLRHKMRLLVAGSIKQTGMYAASKGICEDMVKRLRPVGLNGTYLALAGIYGPHARPFYNSFPTTIMHCVATGSNDYEKLVTSWHSQLELIHVSDVCQNIEDILRQKDINSIDEYGPDAHCMDFWHAGEFKITIEDFVSVVKGGKPKSHVSERNINLIKQTADWYKERGNTTQ